MRFERCWMTLRSLFSKVGLPALLDDPSIFIFKGGPFEMATSLLMTIWAKQKSCQHDNQLTRSSFLIIYQWVQGFRFKGVGLRAVFSVVKIDNNHSFDILDSIFGIRYSLLNQKPERRTLNH